MCQDNASSAIVLGSDDLELLQRFLEAWCEERHVDVSSEEAQTVASGLFNWYQFELNDRNNLKSEPPEPLPESVELKRLLRQLAVA
ncbi:MULTISPECIES: hypothetical protein [Rhizobium/Agrobacterium group]|jgi:hypothetical protein|uniref:Uncharacterized protein n=1 Tax=Rhizobium soli TaxID=424798 RepID=A0A7X0JLZ0_9HYPH|nr:MULTISPECIES: hypothetical protein [Rhizobium/Agrobacterium group]AGU10706.1 hypothetical protein [uncultured organism]KQQ37104.1 hypothetical protein ASG19_12195 [Rhizobium sp. Leaf306]RYZ73979.1 MAG: hypothetical protein EOP05_09595 [Pseudomonadota bacterium]AGU11337.1 hypothetical protein [uncultured organism]KQQ72517.1 hypothetical protein ASF70_13445 [Rhizobium sp. Leaf321]